MQPAVFLDRDGVINRAVIRDGRPLPPSRLEDVDVPADVPAALHRLKAAGFALIVVTNQPDVARGRQTRETVEAIHAWLGARLPIDEFRVCYHDDDDACDCRKPKPGLLLRPPRFDLSRSFMIGDRWRDVEAGRRASVRGVVLIAGVHDEPCPVVPDLQTATLTQAVPWILKLSEDSPVSGASSGGASG